MPMATPTPRRVRRAALYLTLGLTTSLLLAMVAALRQRDLPTVNPARGGERLTDPTGANIPYPLDGNAPPSTQYLELRAYESWGATIGISRLRPFTNYTPAAPPTPGPTPESIASRWHRAELLPWLDGRRPWPDPAKGESIWVKAAGWPFRCLVCRLHAANAPNFANHTWSAPGGLILDGRTAPGWADWPPIFPMVIPFRPLWPELALNTFIFAAVWAALFSLVRALRRSRRQRAGLCERCAYDRRGLPINARCPECAAPSSATAALTPTTASP